MGIVKTEKYFEMLAQQSSRRVSTALLTVYHTLENFYGDLHWWPADSPEEVIIGAILVQNVAWKNVEKAIENLREVGLLGFEKINQTSLEEIEPLIKSTLYFRMKAKKLKAFAEHVRLHHGGRIESLLQRPLNEQRVELLSIYGVGAETADDILLYAAELPSFVVDSYTKRVFSRLGYVRPDIPYETLRNWFMAHLPNDVRLFNQFHAMIDAVGHRLCSAKNPKCQLCPLVELCQTGQNRHNECHSS